MTDVSPEVEQVLTVVAEALVTVESSAQATLEEIQAQLHEEQALRESVGNNLSDPNYPPPWNRALLEVAQVMEEKRLATVAEIREQLAPTLPE